MLSGYKTYILAALSGVGAVTHYLVGDADLASTIQLVVAAMMGATLRHGITASGGKK